MPTDSVFVISMKVAGVTSGVIGSNWVFIAMGVDGSIFEVLSWTLYTCSMIFVTIDEVTSAANDEVASKCFLVTTVVNSKVDFLFRSEELVIKFPVKSAFTGVDWTLFDEAGAWHFVSETVPQVECFSP